MADEPKPNVFRRGMARVRYWVRPRTAPGDMPTDPDAAVDAITLATNSLKHRAKRWNERVKLLATLFNSVAIVTLAAAFINPIAAHNYAVFAEGGWILLVAAFASHIFGQIVLTAFRAEE